MAAVKNFGGVLLGMRTDHAFVADDNLSTDRLDHFKLRRNAVAQQERDRAIGAQGSLDRRSVRDRKHKGHLG